MWISSGAQRHVGDLQRVQDLLATLLSTVEQPPIAAYNERASTMLRLSLLNSWATIYIKSETDDKRDVRSATALRRSPGRSTSSRWSSRTSKQSASTGWRRCTTSLLSACRPSTPGRSRSEHAAHGLSPSLLAGPGQVFQRGHQGCRAATLPHRVPVARACHVPVSPGRRARARLLPHPRPEHALALRPLRVLCRLLVHPGAGLPAGIRQVRRRRPAALCRAAQRAEPHAAHPGNAISALRFMSHLACHRAWTSRSM